MPKLIKVFGWDMVHTQLSFEDKNAKLSVSNFRNQFAAAFGKLFSNYIFAYGTLAIMSVLAILVGANYGFVDGVMGIAHKLITLLFLITMFVLVKRLGELILVERPESPLREMSKFVASGLSDPLRLARIAHLIIMFAVMALSFSVLKSAIAVINPFSWDIQFKELDQLIHFGRLPHEWLGVVTNSPLALFLIGGLYNAWFVLLFFTLFIFHTKYAETRIGIQYITAFYLSWLVIGFFMATYFSSAGPCYFERMGLGFEYSGLMNDLETANKVLPVWPLDAQQLLWDGHTGAIDMRLGISAFPSMHVAIACVMAFGASAVSRFWGSITWAFAFLIMIGSIALGWHYAVDGYASLFAVAIIWFVSGKFADLVLD